MLTCMLVTMSHNCKILVVFPTWAKHLFLLYYYFLLLVISNAYQELKEGIASSYKYSDMQSSIVTRKIDIQG